MPSRVPGICPICATPRARGARRCRCGFDFAAMGAERQRDPAAAPALARRLAWLLVADVGVTLLAVALTLQGVAGAATQGRDLLLVAHVVAATLTAATLHRLLRAVAAADRGLIVVYLLSMVFCFPLQWGIAIWALVRWRAG